MTNSTAGEYMTPHSEGASIVTMRRVVTVAVTVVYDVNSALASRVGCSGCLQGQPGFVSDSQACLVLKNVIKRHTTHSHGHDITAARTGGDSPASS